MEEAQWTDTVDKPKSSQPSNKNKAQSLVSFESSNQTESLILAQDERWRRA